MAHTPSESNESIITNSTNEDIIPPKRFTDLVSQLPTREGWPHPLVLYKNYWLKPMFATNIMILQETFKSRPDDIILATQPKCGTTWLKALAFAIVNRSRYADFSTDHPLLTHHPQRLVTSLETRGYENLSHVEALPSPRLLGTHMPLSLLPQCVSSHGCRIVYICRDPKDALVSRWHFENRNSKGFSLDLASAFGMFCEGFSVYGPMWNHCLEYWEESKKNPDKTMFMKYEEMMLEPVAHVRTLAVFLGAPFTDEEERSGVPEKVASLCSFETLRNLEVNQTGVIARKDNTIIENSAFFRKGKVGDWVNHLSEEMGKRLDDIVKEKLKGSRLSF